MNTTMLYCPQNISLHEVWIDHGVSQCFMDTVTSSIIAGYFLIVGTIQLCMYRRYATEVPPYHLPSSKLYNLQVFLTLFASFLVIVRFVLQAVILSDKTVYGYMILSSVLMVAVYPYSLLVIINERKYLLPSVPTRGHGLVLLLFWTINLIADSLAFINFNKKSWWFHLKDDNDKIEMSIFILRYFTSLGLFFLGLKAPGIMQNNDYLILNDSMRNVIPGPGSENESTWKNIWHKVRLLAPYIWPKKDIFIHFRVFSCFLLLLAGRVINLYVPIYNKLVVKSISTEPMIFRWDLILIYVAFKFLQGGGTGGMGLLNNIRSFLWIKVQQYTTREIQIDLFKHLHGLSLRWHLSRKSGEVLRVMDRGTNSINKLLNYIIFNIFPTLVDITVACIFFVYAFNAWFGLIVFITMALYLVATITLTDWRVKYQRRMNLADNAANQRSVDSLLNFETVKYYGAESYEVSAYREAVLKYQTEEWIYTATLSLLNTMQNIIISGGLLAGSLLCIHMVVEHKQLRVDDYVLFAGYIIQLYTPLNWFGTYYREIQKSFVDMENMFDLLKEEQEIIDAPGAGPIIMKKGVIEFNNVSFGYLPEKLVLKNVTFTVPQGKTIALVGPSGSGKSTIIRLLFRFYDVQTGAIIIDGQNVKTVTQESLRRAIGVVPQDTVLFNNSIKYNIQYGRLNATDVDVIEAARAADIHDRILTFPEAYDTEVGERGLKLSGGEKQRVAIARTILKSPVIVLLDEATSALDTQTERNIQNALEGVCQNRTTIIVAHRLSTIIHADDILVLKDGQIVERGKHEYLIGQDGEYAKMWNIQLKKQQPMLDTSGEFSDQ